MNSADKASRDFTSNSRASSRHRYLNVFLVAVVITALIAGPATVMGQIIPAFASRVSILVLFLVALESGLTTWWLANRNRRFNRLAYRAAEVLIIIILIRMISWLLNGQTLDALALRTYLVHPTEILDFPFVLFSIIALFVWERGMAFTSIFRNLALNPAEITYYSMPTAERFKSKVSTVVPKNRASLYQDYLRTWFTGGIILVGFVVMSTFDLPQAASNLQNGIGLFGVGRLALLPVMLTALMAYFLGGLWLASLGRLHMLEARWLIDGLTPDDSIVKFWQRRSLLLLLIIALLSASLPIGSTLAISKIFMTVALYVTYMVGGLLALIAYLLYLISSLFGDESPPPAIQPLNLDALARDSSTTAGQSELASLIFGGIFWLAIGILVIFALIFFMRDRGISMRNFSALDRILTKLLKWLRELINSLKENAEKVTASFTIPGRYRFFGGRSKQEMWSFLRINSLSPRDQIRFYYLAAVRRAGQKGIRRLPGMTVDEFSEYLINAWPESEIDVRVVTEAFQLARYSQTDLGKRDLPPIREAYRKFRRRLNRK